MLIAKGILVDADVLAGKPAIAGTRIAVQSILNYLAAGDTIDDILDAFPQLTKEHIQDCLAYAASMVGNMEVLHARAV